MLTAGVDLAAENKGTALAVVDWTESGATVRELHLGVADAQIVDAVTSLSVAKLGIDCAFGWPDEFVTFVSEHARGERDPAAPEGAMDWRRTLAYRETDRDVRQRTGRWPLSVSTDRLGLTAMRCAGLLARLEAGGIAVDRSGLGTVVEVYPGASLRIWELDTTGYRTLPTSRERLVRDLATAAPWLDLGVHEGLMVASADALDAVIAAMTARSAALGRCAPPPAPLLARARREGWIALPPPGLEALVG